MTQIKIDLSDEEDKKVELYKAESRLGSKEEAIREMIKNYNITMGEIDLYEPIGKWFIDKKGCQSDEFSKGFVKDKSLGDAERPDVTAVRYAVNSNDTPSIDFYGYVVEVKEKEEDIINDLTKVRLYIKRCKNGELLSDGFHYVSFYVAYIKDGPVDQNLLEICKEDGIGILQLSVSGGKVIGIYEILKPREIGPGDGLGGLPHRKQQSPGPFEESIANSYLSKLLISPSSMYNNLIAPKKTLYEEKNKLRKIVDNVKDQKAGSALEYTLNKLAQFDDKKSITPNSILFAFEQGKVTIRPMANYFYINTEWDNKTFRVHSIDDILEGASNGNLIKSSCGLDEIIKDITNCSSPKKLKVLVAGIGGAGNNTVNKLAGMGIGGVTFTVINTDTAHFESIDNVDSKLFIGSDVTYGKGAGGNPVFGEKAAMADQDAIKKLISDYNLIFLCAGLGGGTGSGATPAIAKLAKEKGIQTVVIVSMPFSLEKQRQQIAEEYLLKLKKICDNVIVLDNDKLVKIVPDKPMGYAFDMLNEKIAVAVRELIDAYTAVLPFTDYSRW